MNVVRTYSGVFAIVLIVVYLFLPASTLVHAATFEPDSAAFQVNYSQATADPCDRCPCSDEQGQHCCDTFFCNCECHAPLGRGMQVIYAPSIAAYSFREPSWSLPQVFLAIFVPPQNVV